MRKRYIHATSVGQGQYQIRNRFSHATPASSHYNAVNNEVPFIGNDMDVQEYDDSDGNEGENKCEDNDGNNKESEYEEEVNDENDKESEYGEENNHDREEDENDYNDYNYYNDDDDDDDDDEDDEDENGYDDREENENDYNDYNDDEEGDEDDEDDEDDNGYTDDPIVDAPLDCNQMPNVNGNFAPYFENATSALLFCWIQKHNICKLIDIVLIIKISY